MPKGKSKRNAEPEPEPDLSEGTTTPPPQPSKAAKKPRKTRAPEIKWSDHKEWVWELVTYLSNHVAFRQKLFSDSAKDAKAEGRRKNVGKDGKGQSHLTLAKYIFQNDPGEAAGYALDPKRYGTSVGTKLAG